MTNQEYDWKITGSREEKTGCGCCTGDIWDIELEFSGTREELKDYLASIIAEYSLDNYVTIDQVYVPIEELSEKEIESLRPNKPEFESRVRSSYNQYSGSKKYIDALEEEARKKAEEARKKAEAEEKRKRSLYESLKAEFES